MVVRPSDKLLAHLGAQQQSRPQKSLHAKALDATSGPGSKSYFDRGTSISAAHHQQLVTTLSAISNIDGPKASCAEDDTQDDGLKT